MSAQDPFVKYRVNSFFHFTDLRNCLGIRKHGGIYSLAKAEEKGIDIPYPGGNDLSHELDKKAGLDKYVHLTLKVGHPMQYVAVQEGRIAQAIYLQVHPDVLNSKDVLFTPGVANKTDMPVYSIAEALKQNLIDFEVLYTRTNWGDSNIQQRLQQAERSEILVQDFIPLNLIRNLP